MKKVKILSMSLAMMALLSTGACKKDKLSCEDAAQAVATATTTWATASNEANCNALKDALNDAIDTCDDAALDTGYKAVLDGLGDCK